MTVTVVSDADGYETVSGADGYEMVACADGYEMVAGADGYETVSVTVTKRFQVLMMITTILTEKIIADATDDAAGLKSFYFKVAI